MLRLLRRRGRLPEPEASPSDPVAEQMPLLASWAAGSIQEVMALGTLYRPTYAPAGMKYVAAKAAGPL